MREDHIDQVLAHLRNLDGGAPLSAWARDRGRAALVREIAGGRAPRLRAARPRGLAGWRGSRRLALTIAVPLIVLALGAAGYAALSSSPSRLSAGVDCHLDHRLGGSGTVLPLDGRAATAICADAWRSGGMGTASHSAPPLQACVDSAHRGAIHVFAGGDPALCAKLGLRSAPAAGSDAAARSFAALSRDLASRFAPAACVSATAARRIARSALARHGLERTWRVVADGFDAAAPCASLAIDSDARVVKLVPIPHA